MIEWKDARNNEFPEDGAIVVIKTWGGEVQTVYFYKGITKVEREELRKAGDPRGYVYEIGDQYGNNYEPWIWTATHGPMRWFGQDAYLWARLDQF